MAHEKNSKRPLVIDALTKGMTMAEAALYACVSKRTIYRWCSLDPELASLVLKARENADDMVEAVTFQNALNPDPANNVLRMFWLKSRRRAVYGERSIDATRTTYAEALRKDLNVNDDFPEPAPPPT